MRLAGTLAATCVIALVAGCASSPHKPAQTASTASGSGEAVVTAHRDEKDGLSSALIRQPRDRSADAPVAALPSPPPAMTAAPIGALAAGKAVANERYAGTWIRPVIVPPAQPQG